MEAVITLHDDLAQAKSGRVYLDDFADLHKCPVIKIRNVNDPDAVEAIRRLDLDWLFIIGWSQIARAEVLASTRQGVLGMHPTLLPEGRGRASIPWAIIKGLPETGVTMFKLDEGTDTGPIVAQERIPLGERETATELYGKVADAHRALIRNAWPDLLADRVTLTTQDESDATEWPGRKPEDGAISPDMTPDEADRLVRAVTHPYPGAFWDGAPGRRLRVWSGTPAPGEDGYVIDLADGQYRALDYEWEDSR